MTDEPMCPMNLTMPDINPKILAAVADFSFLDPPADGWYDCNDINTGALSRATGRFHWCTPRMYHPEGVDMVLIKNNKIVAGMMIKIKEHGKY